MFELSREIAIVITVLGSVSMVVGGVVALMQWDLKRLLAYHSISQVGYVVMAFGMGLILLSKGQNDRAAYLAVAGSLYHLVNHSIFKGLLFLNAGALEHRLETRDLKQMGGLSLSMPLTSTTSFIASMSISGIPPFNGFFSKLIIILAAIGGKFYLLATLAIVASIITLGSFLKFQRFAFFNRTPGKVWEGVREAPFSMAFSMVFLAVLCLGLSMLVFPTVTDTVLGPAIRVLIQPETQITNLLGF